MFGLRNAFYDCRKNFVYAYAAFAACQDCVLGGDCEQVLNLFFADVGLCAGQIHFIYDWDYFQTLSDCEMGVCNRLRLYALRCVYQQQCALARGERARNFVGKVDVSGGVDEV